MKSLFCFFSLLACVPVLNAQILLPREFKCADGKFIANGVTVTSYTGEFLEDNNEALLNNLGSYSQGPTGLRYEATKDGYIVGRGRYLVPDEGTPFKKDGDFVFEVHSLQHSFVATITSPVKSKAFDDCVAWMMNSLRTSRDWVVKLRGHDGKACEERPEYPEWQTALEAETGKQLQYLSVDNGGLVGYFLDGTISGCPRCDFRIDAVKALYSSPQTGTFTEVASFDGSGVTLLDDQENEVHPSSKIEDNTSFWAIYDKRWIKWLEE